MLESHASTSHDRMQDLKRRGAGKETRMTRENPHPKMHVDVTWRQRSRVPFSA